MATTTSSGGGTTTPSTREGTAKSTVADQISQAIQSTSNLLQLMQQSSPSQVHLAKLPKNLLTKMDTIKNTGQVLQQLPLVISSLDAYMENGLHSVPHLQTVTQLLSNMESSQLKSSPQPNLPQQFAWEGLCSVAEPEIHAVWCTEQIYLSKSYACQDGVQMQSTEGSSTS